MTLTKRQRDVINFIETFLGEHGYCPSFEEIARGVNLSSLATVHRHVKNLIERGWLKQSHKARSLEIVPQIAQARFTQKGPDCMWDNVLQCYWHRREKV